MKIPTVHGREKAPRQGSCQRWAVAHRSSVGKGGAVGGMWLQGMRGLGCAWSPAWLWMSLVGLCFSPAMALRPGGGQATPETVQGTDGSEHAVLVVH